MKLYDIKLNWFLEITIIIIINFFSLNFIFIYGNTFGDDDNNSNLTIFYERSEGGVANLPSLSIKVNSSTLSQNETNELNRLIDLSNLSNLPSSSNNNTNIGWDYLTYHLIIERENENKIDKTVTDLNITNEQRQLFLFLENKLNK